MDAQRVLASLGTREQGLNIWRRQIERNADLRRARTENITHDRATETKSNPQIRTTNPNYMPPSEPVIHASNEAIGPGVLMPPFQRNIVMARAALAADLNAHSFFNR